uniref:Rhodanese-related sulfurtransferase n=1 Tax=Candidatus Kentrum sp. TUN TaxID=2126343 RepID=A0A451AMJ6_9GAMM|nr:MAG: Rhodanese-related sulfurtransferase [Candidatus Kentron sp. TUN]VFK59799.1 MAG: Rhodanese-related sulfurtransferase [Candidatus Kentron sp. TUN]VFK67260.1 MAG: Rhodanese-related sulfurtransferase [Candidatus Kentron sp. TUN]
MDQLIEFVTNHWFLTLTLFTIIGLLAWTVAAPGILGAERVEPLEAIRLINHEGAVVLDVRTDGEIEEGRILNAIHVPQQSLPNQIKKLEKYRSKPVIAVCRTGNRSGRACAILRKQGFERVYNLGGGVVGWQSAGLPLVRK